VELTKRHMEQVEEQGWAAGDESVCTVCVSEESLEAAIRLAETTDVACSFCGASPAGPIEALLAPFMAGVRREFEHAADSVYWDGREGGYQAPTLDSWDLIDHYADIFVGDGLLEVIRDAVLDETWVASDWAWSSRDEALTESWDTFCHIIKYETRYVIWRQRSETQNGGSGAIPPARILDAVGDLVDLYPEWLTAEIDPSVRLWRARPHDADEQVESASDLGTTPVAKSRSNRMSPAGIPMFYGAFDARTAALEAVQGTDKAISSTAAWVVSVPAKVLDLTNLQPIPSVFAPNGDERPQWIFLHYFARSLRAKVELEDIDYVPTQVVTEYFLRIFGEGSFFDGLQYMSDVEGGGRCVVMDVRNEGCVEAEGAWDAGRNLLLGLLRDTRRSEPVEAVRDAT
jgi:HEPN/RES N-terminal domain 1/RES domain